jgi:hypothetical protein
MAKGNDGHLLQHAVEAELAFTLFNWGGGKGLYVILTHGMRPFEHFEEPRGGPRKLLDDKLALCLSTDTIAENAPRILSSYRLLRTSDQRYPNSTEIIASVTNRNLLNGIVTEKEDYCRELEARWKGRSLRVSQANWRNYVASDFACPNGLKTPWLISLDPYSFKTKRRPESCSDGCLYAEDLADLHELLRGYLSVYPDGAISVFSYSMSLSVQQSFELSILRDLVSDLPGLHRLKVSTSAGCVHKTPSKHVGYAVSPSYDLLRTVQYDCAEVGLKSELDGLRK